MHSYVVAFHSAAPSSPFYMLSHFGYCAPFNACSATHPLLFFRFAPDLLCSLSAFRSFCAMCSGVLSPNSHFTRCFTYCAAFIANVVFPRASYFLCLSAFRHSALFIPCRCLPFRSLVLSTCLLSFVLHVACALAFYSGRCFSPFCLFIVLRLTCCKTFRFLRSLVRDLYSLPFIWLFHQPIVCFQLDLFSKQER